MSTPYRPAGEQTYRCKVPQRVGEAVARSTGTTDRKTAQAVGRMVADLAAAHRWDVLGELTAKPPTLTLAEVFTHRHELDAWLTARASGPALTLGDLQAPWQAWLQAEGLSDDTRHRYPTQLATLGLSLSIDQLTGPVIMAWLAASATTPATQRRYLASVASFISWARMAGHLTTDPLAMVRRPKTPEARVRFLDEGQVLSLVHQCPVGSPAAAMLAIAYGAACDASHIGRVLRRHVDPQARTVWIGGSKTAWRNRTVRLADYLWSALERRLSQCLPDAPLCPGTRWHWSHVHGELAKGAGLDGYWLRDARHAFAVRLLRAGAPAEVVARQMGLKDATLVIRVYGRWMPNLDEMARWEQAAVTRAQQGRAG